MSNPNLDSRYAKPADVAAAISAQAATDAGQYAPIGLKATSVIFDSDFNTDVDDPTALRIALALSRRGVLDLRGVLISSMPTAVAQAASAMLLDEERPDVPVGQYQGSTTGLTTAVTSTTGNYITAVTREYPATQTSGFTNSVTLARTILAARTSQDLVYISVGYQNNLAAILASPADSISPLTGLQLFAKAVKRVNMMAGNFQSGGTPTTGGTIPTAETNYAGAASASSYVAQNCPVPIWHFGTEIGAPMLLGQNLQLVEKDDYIRRIYEIMNYLTPGRAGYDPITVYAAAFDTLAAAGFNQSQVTVTVDSSTGVSSWTTPNTTGRDYIAIRTQGSNTALAAAYVPSLNAHLVPGWEPTPPAGAISRPLVSRKSVFTPARLTTYPIGWWRYDDLGTVGSSLTSWTGAYGTSLALAQTTSASQPTIQRDYREIPAVLFDGIDDYLAVTDATTRISYPRLFVVARSTQGTGVSQQSLAGVPVPSNASPYWQYGMALDTTLYTKPYSSGGSWSASNIVRSFSVPRVFELAAASRRLFIDGAIEGSPVTSPTAATYTGTEPFIVGGNGASSIGELFKGYIYEILLLDDTKVTATERNNLHQYFRNKYGLASTPTA